MVTVPALASFYMTSVGKRIPHIRARLGRGLVPVGGKVRKPTNSHPTDEAGEVPSHQPGCAQSRGV